MNSRIQRLFQSPARTLPGEMLNLLIEVDNREGRRGLDRLEAEIRYAHARLRRVNHPQAARLNLWLKALDAYRNAYYPRRNLLGRLLARRQPRKARRLALP